MYIYIYIYATARCPFGVTGFSMLLSDFCSPILAYNIYISPP